MSSSELWDAAMADCSLPKDIILDILTRIPVRYLLRFRCVCKPWCTLITNPSFVTMHLNRSTTFNEQLVVHTKRQFESKHAVTLIVRTNKKRNDRVIVDLPPPCDTNFVRVAGSANGLLCLSLCATGSELFLWNPSSREYRCLPERQILIPNGKKVKSVFLGFGFVERTSDFKVVRFLSFKDQKSSVPKVGVVDLYSKRADMWKEVAKPGLKCQINEYSPTAVVDGVVHWLGTKGRMDVIVGFDMGNEVFGDLALPGANVYAAGYGWQVSVLKEFLSVIVYPVCGSMSKSIDVWVMKEYGVVESWVKQSSIRLFSGVTKPVGSFRNGELILQNNKDKLFLYEPRTKKFGTLSLCSAKFVYDVYSYSESLISVRGGE